MEPPHLSEDRLKTFTVEQLLDHLSYLCLLPTTQESFRRENIDGQALLSLYYLKRLQCLPGCFGDVGKVEIFVQRCCTNRKRVTRSAVSEEASSSATSPL